jgi:tol-pal system protein YbgF
MEGTLSTLVARAARDETGPPAARPAVQTPERETKEREAKDRKPKPSATPSSAPPQTLYDRGLESLRGGDYGQTVLILEELVQRHPSHALAPPAQFWIGEAYFRSRDYRHAATEYQKAVSLAQRGEKTPEALYKMGLAYRALKRPDRAREAWTQLLREFPQSPSAERARTALRDLPRTSRPASPDSREEPRPAS